MDTDQPSDDFGNRQFSFANMAHQPNKEVSEFKTGTTPLVNDREKLGGFGWSENVNDSPDDELIAAETKQANHNYFEPNLKEGFRLISVTNHAAEDTTNKDQRDSMLLFPENV